MLLLLGVAACAPATAMQFTRLGDTLVLSGDVERRDLDRATAEFARPPAITHVVLRNSMGGNSWTGYRMGELFRDKGVTTVVSGHCISACSRLFLGGRQRLFSDDYPASLTYVGFHGHYDFGALNTEAVKRNELIAWTIRFTDGRVDPALVARWVQLPRRAGDVRFYPPTVTALGRAETVICQGNESRRPEQCESLSTRAEAQGIVTSKSLHRSADAASLPYRRREADFPSTGFAALRDITRLPSASRVARRDYQQFISATLPRAFAVSADGQHWAWSANTPNSVETALTQCRQRAKRACVPYAVDERVVFSGRPPN